MIDSFVLDVFDDALIVIPLDEARRLAALNDALEASATWGEFLIGVSADAETMSYLRDSYDDGLPPGHEVFDADEVPGFAEGDWPTFPKQAMLDWLPGSVIKLGNIQASAFGPSFLHLDEELASDVIKALADEGIDCEQDTEDLVGRSCGAWRYS